VVSMLALDPKVAGSKPAKMTDFKSDKNTHNAFLSDGK
jgi:hypothetical protein